MKLSILAVAAAAASVTAIVTPWANNPDLKNVEEGPVKTQASWNFIDCGLPEDVVQIESLTISPDPPEPGKNLTVNVSAYVNERIEDGAYADVTVKLGLVKLLHKQIDVCLEAEKANAEVRCPVEPGRHVVSQTVALPKEIPPAKFVVMVRGYTADDENLMCADIQADFRRKPFFKELF
ncbi:Phosphatidylglycerol/phosphatidylinositol transfer protein [Tulasnella sp. JGI-2019a]|nr:Phosphatidylglycerol/phosphatidylinositol transfer protein [Tulasnella sp. JGI-2019a]KAG9008308.1 Phosphatidylglycerol/phosphatidylinositol transfer protein [Tulasnella sp. JGI-2019a]KAG9028954.1 Phosphatidylglycerol/phosphatidylinositol transfer protein [Tulasnella sp. JGI-2019a]